LFTTEGYGGLRSVVSVRKVPRWEGEAPAEPKSNVSVRCWLFAVNGSPGIPARPPFGPTKQQCDSPSPDAEPYHGLILTQQRNAVASSPSWCSVVPGKFALGGRGSRRAASRWPSVTELVLGGRSMGFSPCRPPRSSTAKASRQRKLTGAIVNLASGNASS
jgi:hypothetical protein